jgi:SAM-dependent methyltransferase
MRLYQSLLTELVQSGVMQTSDSVLVVCGGDYDAQVLDGLGFATATISNLDSQYEGRLSGFAWSHQDAENLTFEDASFDWAVCHAGLHHCASPHRALLEMCRVARKGAIFIEARDSLVMRLAVRLGFVSEYELEGVVLQAYGSGGMRNSATPNFIYRWTERDVLKCIDSAYPHRTNRVTFAYALRLPDQRFTMASPGRRFLMRVLGRGLRAVERFAPKLGNEMAAVILHDCADKPWIERIDGEPRLRRDYALSFDPSRYTR